MFRCQGAILRGNHILLIQHREHTGRSYWLLPGGGREDGETEEQCVIREMKEETGLEVRVERLLLDDAQANPGTLPARKTFLCSILSGEARPGYEPEPHVASIYSIVEVGWFDLRDELSWGEKIASDPLTYGEMRRIQVALGYGQA